MTGTGLGKGAGSRDGGMVLIIGFGKLAELPSRLVSGLPSALITTARPRLQGNGGRFIWAEQTFFSIIQSNVRYRANNEPFHTTVQIVRFYLDADAKLVRSLLFRNEPNVCLHKEIVMHSSRFS